MMPARTKPAGSLPDEVLEAFDNLEPRHQGYRPVHAKGVLLAGRFVPSPAAASLTPAPHLHRSSTPVSVRFSNATGVPAIPDNDPNAAPRGMAIRFHLADHVHTDIISHSVDGFPARTPEEFLQLLRAIHESGPDAPKPTPIERFLASHPAALRFVQAPRPVPASFWSESFYWVSAYRFTNADGIAVYGRYRIRPQEGARYLDATVAAAQSADFLFDGIADRLAAGPVIMQIVVQIANPNDPVDDATISWSDDHAEIQFGSVELMSVVPDNEQQQRHIIFDPLPRVDGIEPSQDPLLDARADIYLKSGRRRRAGQ